jgi:tetratricopeptide (TPR) repeat protein
MFPQPVNAMEEPFDSYFDGETLSLVGRFEKMLSQEAHFFFDVDEFEEIIEYYFFKNEQRKAHTTIQKALEQHPGNCPILVRLAQYQVNARKDYEALRILKDTEPFTDADSEYFIIRGNIYSQLEKPEKAIEEYKRAINGADNIDEIYSSIAFEYENLGKYDRSIEYLLKAIEINPENDAALYELTFCCEVSQQTDRCIRFLTDFLDQHPYSVTAWFNLGVTYSNLELFEKALDAYDYVLAIDETFSSAYFNKANCYANLGNYPKAIETYRETIFYEEPEPVTYYYIAECYEKLKDFNSSITYYQKATDLDPEFADAWLGIGISHDELGKPQEALPFILKALQLSPTVPEYWFIYGDIQIKLSRIEEGIAAYRKVTELDPDDADIWLDLSVVYADRQEYDKGLEVLEEGLVHHGSNPDFYYGKAWYLFLTGKSRQAIETLTIAVNIDAEGHKRLFVTFPEAGNHPGLLEALAALRPPLDPAAG